MLLQAEQMHKMASISLKMVEDVILNENSCQFVNEDQEPIADVQSQTQI